MPEPTPPGRSEFQTNPPPSERRAQLRYACLRAILLQPLANRKAEVWRAAQITNISTRGLGLVYDASLERGAILSVRLEGSTQRFSWPLLVRVVRVSERPHGVWRIGCIFAMPLGEDDVRALVQADKASPATRDQEQATKSAKPQPATVGTRDPFIHGGARERRSSHRRRLLVAVVLFYGSGFRTTLDALAVDGSLGGLQLLCRKPFRVGTFLRVRSMKASLTIPSVAVRVKSCRPQQRQWILGVQFVKPSPSDVMLSLS